MQSIETLFHRFVVEPPDEVSRERFAAELVEMLVRYLRKDRLRILGFDLELAATVAEAGDFRRKLAHEEKIAQGRLIARKR